MTTALEGGEWLAARPGLPPGKARYPLYRRLGGPQARSGRAENLAPPGFDPPTVHPVVSRYTDWATGPNLLNNLFHLNHPRHISNSQLFIIMSFVQAAYNIIRIVSATRFLSD